jgi:hypothetical protein
VILKTLQRIFAPIALAWLAWFAWSSRADLAELAHGAEPAYLAIAIILWCLTHALAPIASMLIFGARGRPIGYRTAAGIHLDYLPARYVPGGIWHTVGRIAAFRNLGMDARDLSTFVVVENALAVSTALVLGGSGIAVLRGLDTWGQIGALGALVGTALVVTLPLILRAKSLKAEVKLQLRSYVSLVVLASIYWTFAAAAFVAYVGAYSVLASLLSPLETGAAYLLSWGIGFLAIFSPQGIGVFEVAAAELLRGSASLTSVAALLAGFRLVILVADAIMWGAGRVLRKRLSRPERAS